MPIILHETPYLVVGPDNRIEGYVLKGHYPKEPAWYPQFTITRHEFHVGLGPPHWYGSFANSSSEIVFGPPQEAAGLFLNQDWDRQSHSELEFGLYQGGALIESGELPAAGPAWYLYDDVSIPITHPGAYTLTVDFDQYHVGNQSGHAHVIADFDTTRQDKDPPTLLALNVLHDGETTDRVPPSAAAEIGFRLHDAGGLGEVLLYYEHGGGWTQVPLVNASDAYSGQLPGFSARTYVSLKIVAQDSAGNSLTYEIVPAFGVTVPTFLPLVLRL